MVRAFYNRLGDRRFAATLATSSPWGAALQHGGPPSALMATVAADIASEMRGRLARIVVDFMGPIPLGVVTVDSRVLRGGRQVRLVESAMEHDGKTVVIARSWFIATAQLEGIPSPPDDPLPPALPPPQEQRLFHGLSEPWGYGAAFDWRFTRGGFDQLGAVGVWAHTALDLIEGEPIGGFARALLVADSANGLSAELPFVDWLFIPPSLVVAALREPVGEWIYLEARTQLAGDGLGLCSGRLADAKGWLGTVTQPLLIRRRAAEALNPTDGRMNPRHPPERLP